MAIEVGDPHRAERVSQRHLALLESAWSPEGSRALRVAGVIVLLFGGVILLSFLGSAFVERWNEHFRP